MQTKAINDSEMIDGNEGATELLDAPQKGASASEGKKKGGKGKADRADQDIPDASTKYPVGAMVRVKFSQLELAPNVREELGDINELANSIRATGVSVPVKGYVRMKGNKEIFVVVVGQRRFRAMEKIKSKDGVDTEVNFIVMENDKQQTLVELFSSNDGKALTLLEQAEGVRQMREDLGKQTHEIASLLGKTRKHIQNLDYLSRAPKALAKLIKQNIVSGTTAIALMRKGEEDVNKFLEKYDTKGESAVASLERALEREEEGGEEDSAPAKKTAKVTNKTLAEGELNSMKELKSWLRNADDNLLPESKADFVKFLWAVVNNEKSYTQIDNYFNKPLKGEK